MGSFKELDRRFCWTLTRLEYLLLLPGLQTEAISLTIVDFHLDYGPSIEGHVYPSSALHFTLERLMCKALALEALLLACS